MPIPATMSDMTRAEAKAGFERNAMVIMKRTRPIIETASVILPSPFKPPTLTVNKAVEAEAHARQEPIAPRIMETEPTIPADSEPALAAALPMTNPEGGPGGWCM